MDRRPLPSLAATAVVAGIWTAAAALGAVAALLADRWMLGSLTDAVSSIGHTSVTSFAGDPVRVVTVLGCDDADVRSAMHTALA